jgi:hypothetical protein
MSARPKVVRHLVLWRLKDHARSNGRLRDAELIERQLDSMRAGIPGLLRVEIVLNESASPDASDLLLFSEFASWEALRGYEEHPLHAEFRRLIGPLRTERRVVDWEAGT